MFRVLEPGLQTTVQDGGRRGYLKYGVPMGGAMDMFSFRVANILCGNDQFEAALEIALIGPKLEVLGDMTFSLTGADLEPRLNDAPLAMWRTVAARRGDVISFGKPRVGCRAYLAVSGGFDDVPLVLGSKSTCLRAGFGGFGGRALQAGDILRVRPPSRTYAPVELPAEFVPGYAREFLVRAVMGPQGDHFTDKGLTAFFSSAYTVLPESDRMGYRLKGPAIEHRAETEIISDALPLGAVQVTPDGLPIVIMADGPTAGGYPKIAVVATADTYVLAQARPGDVVRFALISPELACTILADLERRLQLTC